MYKGNGSLHGARVNCHFSYFYTKCSHNDDDDGIKIITSDGKNYRWTQTS